MSDIDYDENDELLDGTEDELDEFDEFDDDDDEMEEPTAADLAEIEAAGFDDGYGDGIYDDGLFQGHGMSVDYDELDEEAREAYEMGYMNGYDLGDDQRRFDD